MCWKCKFIPPDENITMADIEISYAPYSCSTNPAMSFPGSLFPIPILCFYWSSNYYHPALAKPNASLYQKVLQPLPSAVSTFLFTQPYCEAELMGIVSISRTKSSSTMLRPHNSWTSGYPMSLASSSRLIGNLWRRCSGLQEVSN